MTIGELGASGEFIGSIVVMLTLLHLAVRVRQNTAQQKRDALDRRKELAIRTLLTDWLSLTVALLVGLGCSNPPSLPNQYDFRVDATREEVTESFGPPSRKQSFLKTGEAIWGPIETFWSQVPTGSTVEIWVYRVQGGTVELYFVDESARVQGMGFAPTGAVFEAEHQPRADQGL